MEDEEEIEAWEEEADTDSDDARNFCRGQVAGRAPSKHEVMLRKYEFLETIGQGSFGKVRKSSGLAGPSPARPHPSPARTRMPALAGEEGALSQHRRVVGCQDYRQAPDR